MLLYIVVRRTFLIIIFAIKSMKTFGYIVNLISNGSNKVSKSFPIFFFHFILLWITIQNDVHTKVTFIWVRCYKLVVILWPHTHLPIFEIISNYLGYNQQQSTQNAHFYYYFLSLLPYSKYFRCYLSEVPKLQFLLFLFV